MNDTQRAPAADESPDWGTDSLTGLIPPRPAPLGISPAPPATPSVSPAHATRRGPLRLAIYALLLVVALGAASLVTHEGGAAAPGLHVASPRSSAPHDGGKLPSASPPPNVEARLARNPTPKAAAAALARGDYREALAQYRALARLHPEQAAFPALVRVLERRLSPKVSGE